LGLRDLLEGEFYFIIIIIIIIIIITDFISIKWVELNGTEDVFRKIFISPVFLNNLVFIICVVILRCDCYYSFYVFSFVDCMKMQHWYNNINNQLDAIITVY
jgi:uncharacterized membrane protein